MVVSRLWRLAGGCGSQEAGSGAGGGRCEVDPGVRGSASTGNHPVFRTGPDSKREASARQPTAPPRLLIHDLPLPVPVLRLGDPAGLPLLLEVGERAQLLRGEAGGALAAAASGSSVGSPSALSSRIVFRTTSPVGSILVRVGRREDGVAPVDRDALIVHQRHRRARVQRKLVRMVADLRLRRPLLLPRVSGISQSSATGGRRAGRPSRRRRSWSGSRGRRRRSALRVRIAITTTSWFAPARASAREMPSATCRACRSGSRARALPSSAASRASMRDRMCAMRTGEIVTGWA